MLDCFMLMQEENPGFFYAIDMDDEGRMKNVFWVACKRLLGCALLSDETKNIFIWLMKIWLRAMGGKPPNAIITDQDRAMKEAIKEVPEKLSHVLRDDEDFMRYLNICIYKSWSKQQFEDKWHEMVEKCDLFGDDWIHSLYEER
uniref:Protein FAR1-RELATED SEQUENCE n=1 Tax=Medicago truncatula TaxID=3880 RepID=A2Q5B3_MEDTR|nr:Putative phytochrome A signaling protein, related [Medicago truncatula]